MHELSFLLLLQHVHDALKKNDIQLKGVTYDYNKDTITVSVHAIVINLDIVATHDNAPLSVMAGMWEPLTVTSNVTSMGAASCTPTPKSCSGTCSVQESAPTKGGDLHIAVEGSCTKEDVTAATFDIKMIFGGLPVLSKKGNDATKDNNFKLPLNMGSVTIPAVQLPVKAGSKIEIPTVAHVGKLAPSGKLVCKVDAYDQDKNALFSVEVDVSL